MVSPTEEKANLEPKHNKKIRNDEWLKYITEPYLLNFTNFNTFVKEKFNLKYKVKANAEYLDGSWSSQNYEWSTFHFSNYNNSGKIKLKKYTSQNADSLNISVKKIN